MKINSLYNPMKEDTVRMLDNIGAKKYKSMKYKVSRNELSIV